MRKKNVALVNLQIQVYPTTTQNSVDSALSPLKSSYISAYFMDSGESWF